MKRTLVGLAQRVGRSRPMRAVVNHLIWPTIAKRVVDEIRPDVPSESGIAEAMAWKVHSYIVHNTELRSTGKDCSSGASEHTEESRRRIFDLIDTHLAATPGDILEFGVASGESLRSLGARHPQRQVFGFDTFEGLPTEWWTREKGAFRSAPPEELPRNVKLVKGLFSSSVPQFLAEWSGRAALVHVDCDLYQSTIDSLEPLMDRCSDGAIVAFDEYWNYPDFAAHEWLAWHEILVRHRRTARCIAYDGRRAAFALGPISAGT